MGGAKNAMMENEDRLYGNSDKCVCSECVGNIFLKRFILNSSCKIYHSFEQKIAHQSFVREDLWLRA